MPFLESITDMTVMTRSMFGGKKFFRNESTIKLQERAFTIWCNLFLKSKGFEIDGLLDLQVRFIFFHLNTNRA